MRCGRLSRYARAPAALLLLAAIPALGAARRVVIIKADGLPGGLLEKILASPSGQSPPTLPWIRHVFVQDGTVVRNFYVRGVTLSAPSWAMLDTGHHMIVRGNAEYDRYTGHVYDYLNFFPFYLNYARSRRADMPGVEVLDGAGIPLLLDSFPPEARSQSFQLYQRGVRWRTLERTLRRLVFRSPRELFDDWFVGTELSHRLAAELERELLAGIDTRNLLYLDYFFGDFDHLAHLTNDPGTQLQPLERLDALVGRVATEIEASPLAGSTIFVLISDHGMNSSPSVYSQGYDLIHFLGSPEGGGHHVLINRYPEEEYKIRGLYPFVSNVVTPARSSPYLAGQADQYPTVLLDLDGNERCSAYFRNSDLNAIQILLQQLSRADLSEGLRAAATSGLDQIVDRHRAGWERTASELTAELGALRRAITRERAVLEAAPKRWSAADRRAGRDREAFRRRAVFDGWERNEREYTAWLAALRNLLRIGREPLDFRRIRIQDFIAPRAAGDLNTVYELQNYVVGPGLNGLVADPAGALDWQGSFSRIDYFPRLTGIRVRNNVQPGVSAHPIDFIAARIPAASLRDSLSPGDQPDRDAVWLYRSESSQALLLFRAGLARYLPVGNLKQDPDGGISFERRDWAAGLPLDYYEDPGLAVDGDPARWLSGWHTEREWFRAIHRTRYSNGLLGLKEFFGPIELGPVLYDAGADAGDARLLRRLELRRRELARADILILASDHWNFNVRGYNPGGNHGSFFRASTHSVLMFAGAGVPRGEAITEPYDSLNFAPTVHKLLGASGVELSAYPSRPIEFGAQ